MLLYQHFGICFSLLPSFTFFHEMACCGCSSPRNYLFAHGLLFFLKKHIQFLPWEMLCYTCNAFLFALLLTDVICDMYNCSSLFLCFFLSSYLFFLFHSGWQNSSNCSRSHWRAFHPGHSGSNICSLCEKEEHQKEKSLEKILGNRGEMLISSLYVLRDFH